MEGLRPVRIRLTSHIVRLRDSFGRAITDLRVSVTDRCNYPLRLLPLRRDGATPVTELPIAGYARMIELLVGLGVEKVRLTGGEPLLRQGLLDLVRHIRTAACRRSTGGRAHARRVARSRSR